MQRTISAETSADTDSADIDVEERVLSVPSRSNGTTSCRSNGATVKVALAKLRLKQDEERFEGIEQLRQDVDLQEAKEIDENL